MSATLENFTETDDTCPHGEPTDGELSCWFCWREAQGGMAIDDPRRDDE